MDLNHLVNSGTTSPVQAVSLGPVSSTPQNSADSSTSIQLHFSKEQIKICRLLQASKCFLKTAHLEGPSTMKSEDSLLKYNTLIKSSLNCLFVIVERYRSLLPSTDEALIYYKISQILFNETASLDLASDYCNKGLHICTRSGHSFKLKIQLQFLNFQIQYSTDRNKAKKSTLSYFNSLVKDLKIEKDSVELKTLFDFFKFQYFGMTYSPTQCYLILQSLGEQLEDAINENNFPLYQLVLIYEIQQHLFKGNSIVQIQAKFKKLMESQLMYPEYMAKLPKQFKSITLFLDLLISIQDDDFNNSKIKINNIDAWLKALKNSTDWNCTFKFQLNLKIKAGHHSDEVFEFPIDVNWLTLKEYTMLSYFYCGVAYIIKAWNGQNRTDRVFRLSNKYIKQELVSSNSEMTCIEMESKLLRLKYLQILIIVYEILSNFQNDRWDVLNKEAFPQLFEFIADYDAGNFSSQELIVYHKLIAKIYYLFAIRYQRLNELQLAKYYYMKIRKFYSSITNELSEDEFFNDVVLVTFKQLAMGIGGLKFESKDFHNQLYYLSCLNLSILNLNDLYKLKLQIINEFDPNYKTFMDKYSQALKLKNELSLELSSTQSLYESDVLLHNTLKCLNFINANESMLTEPNGKGDVNQDYDAQFSVGSKELEKISQISPLLSSIIYYIKGKIYKSTKSSSDPEFINSKIQLFNLSYKESIKYIPNFDKSPNLIGYLSTLEIKRIFLQYPNLFEQEQLNSIQNKLSILEKGLLADSPDSDSNTPLESSITVSISSSFKRALVPEILGLHSPKNSNPLKKARL